MPLVDLRPRSIRYVVPAVVTAFLTAIPATGWADPIAIRSGTGPDGASILTIVEQFRTDLGGINNGNTLGSQGSGRREINWDGGGAAANATVFSSPMTTFNSGLTTRGAVFTTPGTGFEISGQPSPEFGTCEVCCWTYPSGWRGMCVRRCHASQPRIPNSKRLIMRCECWLNWRRDWTCGR
jgi:hypothetical protein